MRAAWWWIDRWRQSAAYMDMSAEERGVYRELMDELWLRDGVIPNDRRLFERLAGSKEEWARVEKSVLSKFYLSPSGYRNITHDEVAIESKKRALRQKRYRERAGNVTHNVMGNDRDTNEHNVYPSPSPSPSKSKEQSMAHTARRSRTTETATDSLTAPDPDEVDSLREEISLEEKRLTRNLLAVRDSGRDVQVVLDSLPRSKGRAPFSSYTWERSGRSGIPETSGGLTVRRMLNDALEAAERALSEPLISDRNKSSYDAIDRVAARMHEMNAEEVAKRMRTAAKGIIG